MNLGSQAFSKLILGGDRVFIILFSVLLLVSAFWMPLTNIMVSNPSMIVWVSIRIVLFVVGLASLLIFIALLSLNPRPSGIFYVATLVSIFCFTVHTGILDAILWPYFWSK